MGGVDTRRLRVGLIGTGVGLRTYLPGFAATGRADVVAISGSSPARAREFAAANGVPTACADHLELCADPSLDVICVTSPNEHHLEHYVAAAASGKHVVLEKPAASGVEELKDFLAVPTAPGQLVLVDHQLRFNPYLRALREVLLSGGIGTPYQVRIHQQGVGLLAPGVPHSWRFDARRGGGVRLAMGSHLVDLLEFLLGGPRVDTVFGTVDVVVPSRVDAAGEARRATAGEAFSSMLRAGRTTAVLSVSAAAASDDRFDVDVLGTAGEAHFDLVRKLRVSTLDGPRAVVPDGVDPDEAANRKSLFKTSFNHQARALVDAVLDGRTEALAPAATLDGQLSVMQVLDAVLESARSGRSVSLREPVPTIAES